MFTSPQCYFWVFLAFQASLSLGTSDANEFSVGAALSSRFAGVTLKDDANLVFSEDSREAERLSLNESRLLQSASSSSSDICSLFSDISELEGYSDSLIAAYSDQCIDSCTRVKNGTDVFGTWLFDSEKSHPSILSLYCILGMSSSFVFF